MASLANGDDDDNDDGGGGDGGGDDDDDDDEVEDGVKRLKTMRKMTTIMVTSI